MPMQWMPFTVAVIALVTTMLMGVGPAITVATGTASLT